jgi:ESCRT-II complex subunit VPS22
MRRGVGIGGLQAANKAKEQYKAVGDEVKQTSHAAALSQLDLFKSKLEEFALHHREDIRRDPAFRAQFHSMCSLIGVDPLASNKGMWAKTLGIGDYYYELGVAIIEVCLATREANGGMIELPQLLARVNKRRGQSREPATTHDVLTAIKKLKALGAYEVLTIGAKQYARSIPGELSKDCNILISLAEGKGYVTKAQILSSQGWDSIRVDAGLETMLRDGLAMFDNQGPNGQQLFWILSVEVT